jgi:hypothetical protein
MLLRAFSGSESARWNVRDVAWSLRLPVALVVVWGSDPGVRTRERVNEGALNVPKSTVTPYPVDVSILSSSLPRQHSAVHLLDPGPLQAGVQSTWEYHVRAPRAPQLANHLVTSSSLGSIRVVASWHERNRGRPTAVITSGGLIGLSGAALRTLPRTCHSSTACPTNLSNRTLTSSRSFLITASGASSNTASSCAVLCSPA